MKKLLSILFVTLFVSGYSSNSKAEEVKDCFEGLNRATFSLNQGLDKVIFKPVAKAYRNLPTPVRTGTNNVLVNLSSLVTIPNNVLQGELKTAGVNTGRFLINTTVGVLGIFDVATNVTAGTITSSPSFQLYLSLLLHKDKTHMMALALELLHEKHNQRLSKLL